MPELREVWKPLTIGSVTVKNRIMMPPHGVLHADDNVPNDRLVAYYREVSAQEAALRSSASTRRRQPATASGHSPIS
jgi:2,4-dienoyl-CoA reductase-like NADH-dependent reductase (Old Yellow Enzyme family)